MPRSYRRIWIHAIWSTKNRLPFLGYNIEKNVYQFIANQFREFGCPVRIINGMPDHIHCLFLLNPNKSISEVIKQIKGSSSFYMNQYNITQNEFSWQTGYAAFSVSDSVAKKVFHYIKNQKQHHREKTFQEEYDELIELNSVDSDQSL